MCLAKYVFDHGYAHLYLFIWTKKMSSKDTKFSYYTRRIPNVEYKSQFFKCHCHQDPLHGKVLKNANEMLQHLS